MADARKIVVAAVQVESKNGAIAENLAHAEPFVAQAAGRGARLILLPEFLPTGYIFTTAIWDAAETADGPTVRWLRAQAVRHRAYIGASFLEAEGEDFYNTFVLAAPDGTDAGRVRKQTPASFEAFFTRGGAGNHMIATDLGKVGVFICYECMLGYTQRMWAVEMPDLALLPHAFPAIEPGPLFPAGAGAKWEAAFLAHPARYAAAFGVPVLLTNHAGPWETPLPGLPIVQRSRFVGGTAVADSDGKVLGQLGSEEGVVVGEVTLDPARKQRPEDVPAGRWGLPLPWAANMLRVSEAAGKIYYRLSGERKRRARAASGARD